MRKGGRTEAVLAPVLVMMLLLLLVAGCCAACADATLFKLGASADVIHFVLALGCAVIWRCPCSWCMLVFIQSY